MSLFFFQNSNITLETISLQLAINLFRAGNATWIDNNMHCMCQLLVIHKYTSKHTYTHDTPIQIQVHVQNKSQKNLDTLIDQWYNTMKKLYMSVHTKLKNGFEVINYVEKTIFLIKKLNI